MKIAHIADLHCCREHAEEALTSLRFFAAQIKKSPVSMVALAGDTWDASMLNTEGSGFNRFIDAIREIADLAPVAMIYGTPAHDTDGSLEVFRKITCRYGITILEPGQPYFLAELNGRAKIVQEIPGVTGKAIIFGIPEPRKKYLLADNSVGKDETEEAIRSAMHKMCFLLAAKRQEYQDIPCFVLYHGEVAGTVYQNDQTIERGTGISITIDDLTDIGADYYALGHIHKPQKVGNINAYYAGSIYPKNFGETHQASFKIVDVESAIDNERLTSVNTVDFPHPQNMKVVRGANESLGLDEEDLKGKRVWLEITCTREQRINYDLDEILKNLIEVGGATADSRVTLSDIPVDTAQQKILIRFWYPIIDYFNYYRYNIITLSIFLDDDNPSL
jgi:exonuclease SbcD